MAVIPHTHPLMTTEKIMSADDSVKLLKCITDHSARV